MFEFNVTFLELLGKRAVDLLEPPEGLPVDAQGNPVRKEVPIHEDKVIHVYWPLGLANRMNTEWGCQTTLDLSSSAFSGRA